MTLLTSKTDKVGIDPKVWAILDAHEVVSVKAARFTADYTMSTATNAIVIPAGAVVVGIIVDITTAFNDSGTDTLDFGIPGTATQFRATGIAAGTAGQTVTGWQNIGLISNTADTVMIVTYTGQNSDATAGSATVTVLYVQAS